MYVARCSAVCGNQLFKVSNSDYKLVFISKFRNQIITLYSCNQSKICIINSPNWGTGLFSTGLKINNLFLFPHFLNNPTDVIIHYSELHINVPFLLSLFRFGLLVKTLCNLLALVAGILLLSDFLCPLCEFGFFKGWYLFI